MDGLKSGIGGLKSGLSGEIAGLARRIDARNYIQAAINGIWSTVFGLLFKVFNNY